MGHMRELSKKHRSHFIFNGTEVNLADEITSLGVKINHVISYFITH